MDIKEQKAKRYAESIPQFDDRKKYCIEDFCAGWEAAMQYLYKLPLDLAIEEIINQNKGILQRKRQVIMEENDKLTAIRAHRRSCPQWNCCKLRIGKIICTEECEYVRRFVKLINE